MAEGDEKFSVEDDARELDEDYDRAVQRDAAEDEPTERGRSFLPKREQSGTDYAAIATAEIERRAQAAKWAIDLLKQYGYRVDRQGYGEIFFSAKDINAALNYAKTNEERAALAALPQVLKRGIEIGRHNNHKSRTKQTITFAAPVSLNGIRGNMAVVVNRNGNHFYAHRIVLPDGTVFSFSSEKTDATPGPSRGVTVTGSLAETTSAAPIISLADDSADVKQRFSIDDDAEYLSIAEKYRDGTATEEETEQLRQMVDEAAKN